MPLCGGCHDERHAPVRVATLVSLMGHESVFGGGRSADAAAGARARALHRLWIALAVAAMALFAVDVCAANDAPNLVARLTPARSEGVRRARVLTDGVQARSGAGWNTQLSAVWAGPRSFVEYDLGQMEPIESVYLQADNNDSYVLAGSSDGSKFQELWVAGPTEKTGMRARRVSALGARARYLRLSARAGDGSYAVSELQVSTAPYALPAGLVTRSALPASVGVRNALLTFGLAVCAFVLFAAAELPWYGRAGLGLVPAAAAVALVSAVADCWPLDSRELSLLRSVVAAVALFALVRERLGRRRYPASAGAVNLTLTLAALLSAASFYDLGHPQFWNAKEVRPEFVHQPDMRVYYPFAKYFDELGYDGVYAASVAAYVEDVPGASLESVREVEIRSLTTHKLERVADVAGEIANVSRRFTPARWTEFKSDMRYFRETMGDRAYLATHADHGANATPVWVALARPWLAFQPASERALVVGGLLDPVLLAIMFSVVGFTFGLRTMLLAVIVFGATDLYMFGTNWGGATLRHDWLAYLGLGVCALRRERWVLGGVLLGLSAMIRAFPAVVLVGVGAACGIAFLERWLRERRFPTLRRHLRAHEPALRVCLAAAGCVAISIAVTGAMFGVGRWAEWWRKVALLDSDMATNDVSLRSLISFGTEQAPDAALSARLPLYLALFAAGSSFVIAAARRVRIHQAALLALPLIVIAFNPANYYVHFIALLPLLGEASRAHSPSPRGEAPSFTDLAISGPLLALCVAEYWTVLDPDIGRHFQYETLLTFAALGWISVNVGRTLWPELGAVGPLETAPVVDAPHARTELPVVCTSPSSRRSPRSPVGEPAETRDSA